MAQDDESSGRPQPLPGHETQSDEMACPKCGRFVGAATKCPYCGAKVEKRMSLVALRWAAVLLSTVGLVLLWLMARTREPELVRIGDIEATLCALDEVSAACVVPVIRDGAISHLVAVVVPADLDAPRGFALTKQLKREMRESVPTYMVPRAFKYADELPLNPNGKADRKALAALVNERA